MPWYDNLPKNSNIEGYWKLEETSGIRYDASPNNNDLDEKDVAAPVGYTTGVSGNCAVFTNVVDEYLLRTYANCIGLKGETGFTLRFFFKPTDPQTGPAELIGKSGAPPAAPGTDSYFAWWDDSGRQLYFQVSDNGQMSGVHMSRAASQVLTTGAWHEIWCVFDGDNQKIYVYADKTKNVGTGIITSAHNETFYDFKMGVGYKGNIDQAVFWNIPLTEDNILGKYKAWIM